MIIATADFSSAPPEDVEDFTSLKATLNKASLTTYVKPKRKSRYTIRVRPGQKDPRLSLAALAYPVFTPQISCGNSNANDNSGFTSTEETFPRNPSAVSLHMQGYNASTAFTETSTDTFADKCTYSSRGVEYLEAGESLCDGKQGLDTR